MAENTITCPDDLPQLPDFDFAARRADLLNDSGLTSAYSHTPITRAQLDAAIANLPTPRLSAKQAA